MKKWPHKCTGWKPSESDPSFCANCGNIASGHKGPTPGAPRQFRLAVPARPTPDDVLLKDLTEKFLAWKLPPSVCADGCVTDPKYPHARIGTNLLNYPEARQLMQEVVIPVLVNHGIWPPSF